MECSLQQKRYNLLKQKLPSDLSQHTVSFLEKSLDQKNVAIVYNFYLQNVGMFITFTCIYMFVFMLPLYKTGYLPICPEFSPFHSTCSSASYFDIFLEPHDARNNRYLENQMKYHVKYYYPISRWFKFTVFMIMFLFGLCGVLENTFILRHLIGKQLPSGFTFLKSMIYIRKWYGSFLDSIMHQLFDESHKQGRYFMDNDGL